MTIECRIMSGAPKRSCMLQRGQRGDVLMEYVVLLVLIVTPLVLGTGALFNPSGDYTGNFGALGGAFQQWYQRLVAGIGLPIP